MKRLRVALAGLLAATALVAPTAQASSSASGLVIYLHVMDNGTVLFHHLGSRTATPTCATNTARWAFDGSTPAGQAKLALLTTAYATKQPIVVYGKGACNVWGDTETVEYFHTMD
ncbi:hypothetical protein DMC18_23630 [Caulobacter sp. D5]|uniref:hypothetical protein n=1 Tax=Caulobacter sp. D5 TaxID=357400 RepID=UPI000D738E61|nr:hypothetical protein [Caulobacter sp. D5]PXA84658.1 hypothetical protein DMC18_23630 [Caulobacter sp. D5]